MGIEERTETTKKGDLIVGEIVMGRGPISLVLVNVGIVHIHGSPVNTGTVHIHSSLVNVRTVHVHGSMQTGVWIPQKSNSPVMLPWMK